MKKRLLLIYISTLSIPTFIDAELKSQKKYQPKPLSFQEKNALKGCPTYAKQIDIDLLDQVHQNNVEAARILINKGARANERFGMDQPRMGYTPLKIAIRNNSLPMAQLLIDCGADVNASVDVETGICDDHRARVPEPGAVRSIPLLSYAIVLNRVDMVNYLIKSGADVNKPDPIYLKYWTPLKIARLNKRTDIEKILIAAGATE